MSTTTLRHHLHTFAFIPRRRDQRILNGMRSIRIRTSRRRMKQVIRQTIQTLIK